MRYLIGRYHEIALKGRNRGRFVEKVKANLRAAFADFPLGKLRGEGPRLIAELPDEITDPLVIERAARVFGLQNFTISREAPLEITAIRDAVVASVKNLSAGSFRIKTR